MLKNARNRHFLTHRPGIIKLSPSTKASPYTFEQTMHNHGIGIGGKLRTCAEQLLAEGGQRGEQRTKVEIVEGLIRAGIAWDVIETAIGLTEEAFQELKTQVAGSG